MSERVMHARTGHYHRIGLQMFEETLCGFLAPLDRRTEPDLATCARCRRVIEREKEGRDGR